MEKYRMKISEFAHVTGITRRTLLFYDKIGLLSPAEIDRNNSYRYYTYPQIDIANVITVLREIGMPLKQVKDYISNRSPENLVDMLQVQKTVVQEKIQTLEQINDMLDTRISLTKKGMSVRNDISTIEVKEYDAVPLLLGPKLPETSHVLDGWYYLVEFYDFCNDNQIIRGLPAGSIISHSDLLKRNFSHPSRYYYCPLSGGSYPSNSEKPKGLYVIGREYGEYSQSAGLYDRILNYIKEAGLKVCGDAYEEYLFDETSTIDSTKYLLQIEIHVQ
ncbi:MerR family transcriptional regulator [Kineothrix sedimenti]|uniref:MerR family transcriptional regulator n=1 Tax=Kineothrix sedimenti TaxID=3123317 RepID=A0ABZ3EXK8_9FIRM